MSESSASFGGPAAKSSIRTATEAPDGVSHLAVPRTFSRLLKRHLLAFLLDPWATELVVVASRILLHLSELASWETESEGDTGR